MSTSIFCFSESESYDQGENPFGWFEGEKVVWYELVGIPNRRRKTMAMKKIAISLPEPVLEQVDKLAASRGESRSHLIATVLDRVARAKRDRDITAQIDALLADGTMAAEQKATADEFLQMSPWLRGKW
jgi:Arc/MetJ-type ribon-helix-helix transcriptional regulator